MCDRGRTITHMQIPRFHTQVWYDNSDVIMHTMASQITGVSIACLGADQRKYHSSASLAFVRGLVYSPHKRAVTRKMFPFDHIILKWSLFTDILSCDDNTCNSVCSRQNGHDGVIKSKPFSPYWSFVKGIHRSPVDSPHKDQWRWALFFSLICTKANGSANTRDAGDLRHHCAHYDVTVMIKFTIMHPHRFSAATKWAPFANMG